MREYDFGDIYDCREAPNVKHFIVLLGTQKIENTSYILFEKVTSRVYKAFSSLSVFFEKNCHNKCKEFIHNFKKDDHIYHYGKLCNTLFLDKEVNFSFTEDSMIVIKGDPEKTEVDVFEGWIKEKMAKPKTRIANVDIYKLIAIIKNSDNISDPVGLAIRTAFNKIEKDIKNQKREKLLARKQKNILKWHQKS